MNIESLVLECIQSAIDYGIASYEVTTNSRRINKLYKINSNNFNKLKSQGSEGRVRLLNLLENDNDYVRYSAAVHLLPIEEYESKRVLNDLSTRSGLFGFSVEMVLKEWNKGNLRDYLA